MVCKGTLIRFISLGVFMLSSIMSFAYELTHTIKTINPLTQQITLNFKLAEGEYLYKDSLRLTVNNPHIKLSNPSASAQPTTFFDETDTVKKEGFTGTVSFTTTANADQATNHQTALHAHFLISKIHEAQEKIIPLTFGAASAEKSNAESSTSTEQPIAITSHSETKSATEAAPDMKAATTTPEAAEKLAVAPCAVQQPSLVGTLIQKIISFIRDTTTHLKSGIVSLFARTGSPVLRLIAALLLGIMLSLTPCIYPMIPITVGILQASGSRSTRRNFLLALFYTLGISTTFALFGFLAALGSCVFGELQGSPFMIIPIAALLIYFGLTMFDVVSMYIPRWLQPKATSVKGGSFLSAYLFGALSGTIASPCLSPGLILILNYVTKITAHQIAHYIESFALLFLFGIGSSLPLLIIGTFSGSLHVLPKAGAWMNEVKKLVGIMLFAMAFYHLSHLEHIFPWYIFSWVVALCFILLGGYYFVHIKEHDSRWMRRYKNLMGVILIGIGCLTAMEGFKAVYDHKHPMEKQSAWIHDYDAAVALAKTSNKPLFIDIGATYCSACVMLDKQIFAKETIQKALQSYVQLKIDSDVHTDAYAKALNAHKDIIKGFPTYIVVDPKGKVLKTWSIDINDLSLQALADELDKIRSLPPSW